MNQQTIFTVYVLMQSQSDCDEAKRICEEYELSHWKNPIAFEFGAGKRITTQKATEHFYFEDSYNEFGVFLNYADEVPLNKTEVTLTRFKELCEEWKQLNK